MSHWLHNGERSLLCQSFHSHWILLLTYIKPLSKWLGEKALWSTSVQSFLLDKIHPSIHPSILYTAYPAQDYGVLEPILADFRQKADLKPVTSQSQDTDDRSHLYSHRQWATKFRWMYYCTISDRQTKDHFYQKKHCIKTIQWLFRWCYSNC